jgi:hypothetical protein
LRSDEKSFSQRRAASIRFSGRPHKRSVFQAHAKPRLSPEKAASISEIERQIAFTVLLDHI